MMEKWSLNSLKRGVYAKKIEKGNAFGKQMCLMLGQATCLWPVVRG